MADGQVVFEIVADDKKARANIKEITKEIEKESKKWDAAVDDSAEGASDAWEGAVGKIFKALSAAGITAAVMKWSKAAIHAASDLEEVQNVVDVTFGGSAGIIEKWAQSAGKQYGLTETAAKRYTSTIGAMLKSQGMADDEIVQTSTDLAGLAADMASFYNLDFETAFQKIRSGISGETEPLKQLGINMSVVNLEAFAMEKGITKAFSTMSQSEQTALRYQYLMKATADAQGDFARTSDGFANASRRIETAMDTIMTKGGELLLPIVADITDGMATFLEQITTKPDTTALDDIVTIEKEAAAQMADLQATYNKASDILNLIKEIEQQTATLSNGSVVTFEELFRGIGEIEAGGGDTRAYISGLGLDVDFISQKYQTWKEAVKQLTSTIPSLTSVINAETGAIDGGTDALQRNLDEWRANEEKKIAWSAYYAKERALAEKKASLYMYAFDADAAREALKRMQQAISNVVPELDINWDAVGLLDVDSLRKSISGLLTDEYVDDSQKYYEKWDKLKDLWTDYDAAQKKAAETADELARQTGDYSEAEQQLADGKQALIDKYDYEAKAVTTAAQATGEWTAAQKEAGKATAEAIKALADYAQAAHDSTEQAVNSVLKGFDRVKLPTQELEEKRSKLIEQQLELNRSTKDGEQKYQELQRQIDELNKSIGEFEPSGMKAGLESQLAFMDEYIKNLDKAREMGLSDELLASLSDGSVESGAYLANLVDPLNAELARQVDDLFQQVQEKKKSFADVLTEQKLAADETFQGMVDAAQDAINGLDLGDAAESAMGKTIAGLAQGIANHVPEVRDSVTAVLDELNRLDSYGVNFNLSLPTVSRRLLLDGFIDGEHETGLNFVPFDGYLASLHEGEGILTAEENRLWQRFKDGGHATQNVDYDALGATMRENVKPGGNVYLDGRVVGQVISKAQGDSYRQLQRSGWQG